MVTILTLTVDYLWHPIIKLWWFLEFIFIVCLLFVKYDKNVIKNLFSLSDEANHLYFSLNLQNQKYSQNSVNTMFTHVWLQRYVVVTARLVINLGSAISEIHQWTGLYNFFLLKYITWIDLVYIVQRSFLM